MTEANLRSKKRERCDLFTEIVTDTKYDFTDVFASYAVYLMFKNFIEGNIRDECVFIEY